ncbi:MAG TPA: carboxypeptidase regulatory-like domain-containing protein [Myxococcota bacterium]|nr:carboxypeptidase regulatory-like domain-containing protein [Myxococcota bacterium]
MRLRRHLALLLLCAAVPAAAQETAGVAGRVTLGVEGVRLADLGQTVVFVDDGGSAPPPAKRATIRQRNAYFAPDFLAIAAGQSVDMPNDDQIFHNVFSFSKPNDFDLGLYPAGQSRQVTFEHAGVVKIYCSIHESMSGTIFVSPSPWFAVAKANGDFEIDGIPPGRHTLRVWNEKLPEVTRSVNLEPAERERVDIQLEAGH